MKTHTSYVLTELYRASRKAAGLFVRLPCLRAMRDLRSMLRMGNHLYPGCTVLSIDRTDLQVSKSSSLVQQIFAGKCVKNNFAGKLVYLFDGASAVHLA